MTDIVGITRVRDESLIIGDTIRHFLKYCDQIILYDDCSTDDTVAIAQQAGGKRIRIIPGDRHRPDRQMENTRHRAILLNHARQMGGEWCLCFDADERLIGELPPLEGDGFQFRLFDGYLTKDRQEMPEAGGRLSLVPRLWGPEYRDILMLFRIDKAAYRGTGRREPLLDGEIALAPVMVKHFGKCISIEQWEETCNYYCEGFPGPFRTKWAARRGKAIHTMSDFNRYLFEWEHLMGTPSAWVKI